MLNLKENLEAPLPRKTEIPSLSNDAYRKACREQIDQRVKEINQHYQKSASEAWKHYVR